MVDYLTNLSPLGIVILALAVWAIWTVWQTDVEPVRKVIWSAVIFALPFVGLIVWWFWGPRR